MESQTSPTIGQLIVAAFGLAQNSNKKIHQHWIQISHRIGSQLPQSLLANSIQRLGEIDLLCRALEQELLDRPPPEAGLDFRFNYLWVLSEWWVGSAYAVCFTLKGRKILTDHNFLKLADDLRMIRVQIEKHEVPSDKNLGEPLQFSPTQLRPDEKTPPIFRYDKNDRLRAHIPRRGASSRQSAMWEVFDVKADESRWYERLELSDRMLNLFDPQS
jgi:hypothetical protein